MKTLNLPQQYRGSRHFGSGWSSVIYQSCERQSNGNERTVIIKRLRRKVRDQNSKLIRPHLIEAMLREASALRICRHAGIPEFIEWLEVQGDPCIVMEHLPGRTVSQIIEANGPLTWQSALHMTLRLLEILESIHRAGWIHCDLNPSNVLLNREHVYLVDFGAAQRIGKPSQWEWPLGRHRYMPPEHLQGRDERPRYSRLSLSGDLHQIACLLIYTLTLRESFRLPLEEEEYSTDYLRNLGNWMAQPVAIKLRTLSVERNRPDVPTGLDRIISRSLEPDPDARYSSATAMKIEILQLLECEKRDESN